MIPRDHLPNRLTESQIATVCVYCRRVRARGEVWRREEDCFLELMNKHLSHGACPSCYHEALALLEEEMGVAPG